MSNCIGWNQLTAAQQQKIPAEYQNKDIPISVIQQNNIELTYSQWSVFNASPVQNDVTNYKLPEGEVQAQNNTFLGKAASVAQKLVVGSGVGVVVGFLASLLFPVGGAIACGIIAGVGGYLYASKKSAEAQQAQQQTVQNQQAQNTQAPEQKAADTTQTEKPAEVAKSEEAEKPAETEPEPEVETKSEEADTTSQKPTSAELKAQARAAQDKYGVTREVQKMWADYYEAQKAEAIASGDPARIKAAQEAEDKFYRENPGYAKSVGKYPTSEDSATVEKSAEKPAETTKSAETTTPKTKAMDTAESDKLFAQAKVAQAKEGVTRGVQEKYEAAYKKRLEEAKATGDQKLIDEAQKGLDNYYKNNPGYAKSVAEKEAAKSAEPKQVEQAVIDSCFTPEEQKLINDASDAMARRKASDKAEAQKAAEAKAAQTTTLETPATGTFTPEVAEKSQEASDAFAKRNASDKAEAQKAAEAKAAQTTTPETPATGTFTPEVAEKSQGASDAFAKRKASDKAEAQKAAEAKEATSSVDINSILVADLSSEQREARITNPKPGSKLAILYKQLETVENLSKTNTATSGYLPSIGKINEQIDDVIASYTTLSAKIEDLEKETSSEKCMFRNRKLKELENCRKERDNLY